MVRDNNDDLNSNNTSNANNKNLDNTNNTNNTNDPNNGNTDSSANIDLNCIFTDLDNNDSVDELGDDAINSEYQRMILFSSFSISWHICYGFFRLIVASVDVVQHYRHLQKVAHSTI